VTRCSVIGVGIEVPSPADEDYRLAAVAHLLQLIEQLQDRLEGHVHPMLHLIRHAAGRRIVDNLGRLQRRAVILIGISASRALL